MNDHWYRRTLQRLFRRQAVAALGGRCCRCGFSNPLALQLDHVAGGGNYLGDNQRGATVTRDLAMGRRREEFQLLCANCNWIKRAGNPLEKGGHGRGFKNVLDNTTPDVLYSILTRGDAPSLSAPVADPSSSAPPSSPPLLAPSCQLCLTF